MGDGLRLNAVKLFSQEIELELVRTLTGYGLGGNQGQDDTTPSTLTPTSALDGIHFITHWSSGLSPNMNVCLLCEHRREDKNIVSMEPVGVVLIETYLAAFYLHALNT